MIMAGGTGGHVFPALAVANALRNQGVKITWLGTHKGIEATVVPRNNIKMEWVSVNGLRGNGLLSWLMAPFKLLRAIWQSATAIRKVKPDCILGMGGFVSGPGGLAARLMRKPLVIHEQNAVAGLTNKYLSKIASRVLSGFPNVIDLPVSTQWIGNPVRSEILSVEKRQKTGEDINVLVIGGSQGANSLNIYLPQLFANQKVEINVWHQSGKKNAEGVISRYEKLNMQVKVTEFIDDMATAYEWADLLVCRAGAMTIAECCAAAKPALLIPYPFSAGDHQQKNAEAMHNAGGALIVSNEVLSTAESLSELTQLLSDKDKLYEMGQSAYGLTKPNALSDVIKVCEEYLHA